MTYKAELILAHGAGQGMDSDFMQQVRELFEQRRILCRLFNFDYMAKAQVEGKKRPPDSLPKLSARFEQEIAQRGDFPLFIGGKSMGGRVASLILEESPALAAVCFGYPFHPPGKPEKLRTEHLQQLQKPLMVLQGERDPFGKPDEIAEYQVSDKVVVQYIIAGEHSLKPLKSSPVSWEENLKAAVTYASDFMTSVIEANHL